MVLRQGVSQRMVTPGKQGWAAMSRACQGWRSMGSRGELHDLMVISSPLFAQRILVRQGW